MRSMWLAGIDEFWLEFCFGFFFDFRFRHLKGCYEGMKERGKKDRKLDATNRNPLDRVDTLSLQVRSRTRLIIDLTFGL